MEGLSGSERATPKLLIGALCAPADTAHARTGLGIFSTCCSPLSSKLPSHLPSTSLYTVSEIRMSPRIGDPLQPDGIVAPLRVCQTSGTIADRCVERRSDVRRGAFVRNRGDKTITAALHVGDVMFAGLFSIERFTQRRYVHAETDFFHNDVRPNLGDQHLVSDHFSGAFDQRQ